MSVGVAADQTVCVSDMGRDIYYVCRCTQNLAIDLLTHHKKKYAHCWRVSCYLVWLQIQQHVSLTLVVSFTESADARRIWVLCCYNQKKTRNPRLESSRELKKKQVCPCSVSINLLCRQIHGEFAEITWVELLFEHITKDVRVADVCRVIWCGCKRLYSAKEPCKTDCILQKRPVI